jgi:hypothetical protein
MEKKWVTRSRIVIKPHFKVIILSAALLFVLILIGFRLIQSNRKQTEPSQNPVSWEVTPDFYTSPVPHPSTLATNVSTIVTMKMYSGVGKIQTMAAKITWDPTQYTFDQTYGLKQASHGFSPVQSINLTDGIVSVAYIPLVQGGDITLPGGEVDLFSIKLVSKVNNPVVPTATGTYDAFIQTPACGDSICANGETEAGCPQDCRPLSSVVLSTEFESNPDNYNPRVGEEFTMDVVMRPNGERLQKLDLIVSYSPQDVQLLSRTSVSSYLVGEGGLWKVESYPLSSQTQALASMLVKSPFSRQEPPDKDRIYNLRFKRLTQNETRIQFVRSNVYKEGSSTPLRTITTDRILPVTVTSTSTPISTPPWCMAMYPPIPENVTAVTASQSGTIRVQWSPVQPATKYEIVFGTDFNNLNMGTFVKAPAVDAMLQGLIPGRTYYARVRAINDCASGGWSVGASAIASQGQIRYPYGSIQLKTKLKGVSRPGVSIMAVVDIMKANDKGTPLATVTLPFQSGANGVFSTGTVSQGQFIPGPIQFDLGGYTGEIDIRIKGPKHVRARFDGYQIQPLIDLSQWQLVPGDLPWNNGKQDGGADVEDWKHAMAHVTKLGEEKAEDLAIADINYDGVVDESDVSAVRLAATYQGDAN